MLILEKHSILEETGVEDSLVEVIFLISKEHYKLMLEYGMDDMIRKEITL
jgi:hypothetical protein